MENIRSKNLLPKNGIALLVIDIQERLLPAIFEIDRVVDYTKKLVLSSRVFSVPVYYTEQYAKGLGATTPQLTQYLEGAAYYHKMTFSCAGAPGLFNDLKQKGITSVVVAGIESHVCVLQTVFDLLSEGFRVFVAADAVSSRFERDYNRALERMRAEGAVIASTESLLFEMSVESGTPEFKRVSKIVKGDYSLQ